MAIWSLEQRDGKIRVDYLRLDTGLIQPCGDTEESGWKAVNFCITEGKPGDLIAVDGYLFQHLKEQRA